MTFILILKMLQTLNINRSLTKFNFLCCFILSKQGFDIHIRVHLYLYGMEIKVLINLGSSWDPISADVSNSVVLNLYLTVCVHL